MLCLAWFPWPVSGKIGKWRHCENGNIEEWSGLMLLRRKETEPRWFIGKVSCLNVERRWISVMALYEKPSCLSPINCFASIAVSIPKHWTTLSEGGFRFFRLRSILLDIWPWAADLKFKYYRNRFCSLYNTATKICSSIYQRKLSVKAIAVTSRMTVNSRNPLSFWTSICQTQIWQFLFSEGTIYSEIVRYLTRNCAVSTWPFLYITYRQHQCTRLRPQRM